MYSIALRIAARVRLGGNGTVESNQSLRSMVPVPARSVLRKLGDGRLRQLEVFRVDLDTDAVETASSGCGNRGAGTHERVQDGAFAHRERCPHDLPHESLGL